MEKLQLGLTTALIGMGVVITVLIVLAVLTSFMSKLLNQEKKDAIEKPKEAAGTVEQAHMETQDRDPDADTGMTPELVALLSAAAMACIGKTRRTYVIKSMKRSAEEIDPNWKKLSRYEQQR